MGTLVLKGPKHLSLDPGVMTILLGSMLALKAIFTLSEAGLSRRLATLTDCQASFVLFFFCTFHLSPECWRTLLLSVLMSCHKDCTLAKAASSSWYMSLAAQQQPRWRVNAQSQSHVSQLRGWLNLTGK